MNRISRAIFLAFATMLLALASSTSSFAQQPGDQRQYETVTTENGVTLHVPVVQAPTPAQLAATASVKQTFRLYPVRGFTEDKDLLMKYVDFSDMAIGEVRQASYVKFSLPNGWQITLHYWVKRTGEYTWWAYAELASSPSFTIAGGPWARGSQIVWIGDLYGRCSAEGPPFERVIDLAQGGNEVGWLDLSERGTGPNGNDGLFHRQQYYPVPGSQDVAKDGMTIRYFGHYNTATPAGERIGWTYGVHIIDEARRSNLYLIQFEHSLVCESCKNALTTRDASPRRMQ